MWACYERLYAAGDPRDLFDFEFQVDRCLEDLMHPTRGVFNFCRMRTGHRSTTEPMITDHDDAPEGLFDDPPTVITSVA